MRRSILFMTLCAGLDELSTFLHLFNGGVELNPRVAGILQVHPLLYPLFDVLLILVALKIDRSIREYFTDVWLVWASAGIGRLICFSWSMV